MSKLLKPFVIKFWRAHDDHARLLEEIRSRYRESHAFARLLHAAVSHRLGGGKVVIQGKPNARKVLRYVLDKLLNEEQAAVREGKAGVWQWLELKPHPYTKRRVWQKVSRARAWARCIRTCLSDTPFSLMWVLGYPGTITRAQAKLVEEAHYPKFITLLEPTHERYDNAYDLEPQENEHFRDDRGSYDSAGVLQPRQFKQGASWESAYLTKEEAWNQAHAGDHEQTFGGRFYPAPMWSREYRRIDWHGAMRVLEHRHHQQSCQQALEDLRHRQSLALRRPTDAPWWSLTERERETLQAADELRRRQLETDDAEVASRALEDVHQTDLELLEEQVRACRKAPQGLIAALAKERLAARAREQSVREQQEGLVALELAAGLQVAA